MKSASRLRGAVIPVAMVVWFAVFGTHAARCEVPTSLGTPVSPDTWSRTVASFSGNHTLFTFWEVTCEPCIAEMPGLISLYKDFKPKGLEIVAVNTDPQMRFDAAAKLLDRLEVPFVRLYKQPGPDLKFRQIVDPEYGANPFAILYDPEGNKIRTFPREHSEKEWRNLLLPYLEKQKKQGPPNEASPIDLSDLPGIVGPSLPDLPGAKVPPPLSSGITLPALGEGGLPAGGRRGPPRNPFSIEQPKWTASNPTSGTLTFPFRCERDGHILLGTVQYEKLRGKGISLGKFSVSKLDVLKNELIDMTEEILYTPGSLFIPLERAEPSSSDDSRFRMRITYQGCTDGPGGACYPPDTYILSGNLRGDSHSLVLDDLNIDRLDPFAPIPTPDHEETETPPSTAEKDDPDRIRTVETSTAPLPEEDLQGDQSAGLLGDLKDIGIVERTLRKGLLLLFGLAFLGGILTSFTPCVYPMIPATVAIFGAKDVKSKTHSCALAATYIMGVALSYAAFGVLAAAVGTVFGTMMENPWVISIVAGFYIVLALMMLDVLTFYMPSSWLTAATKVNRKGFLGAFLMGMVSSIVFAPCGEPILLGLLGWVAKTQSFFLGFWLLFVYAWGIGVLFFVIAVFSSSLQYLPKAGVWMVAVKDFFGLVLLGLAIYWLHFVFEDVWIMALLTLYLLGTATFVHVKNQGSSGWARGFLSFVTMASLLLATIPLHRVAAHQGWVPGGNYPDWNAVSGIQGSPGDMLNWRTETPLSDLRQARMDGKPVVLDFRTNVCEKCDILEETVFAHPTVREALSDYVTIQVNLSDRHKNPEILELQALHEVFAVPVIGFYDSQGNYLPEKTIADVVSVDEFIQRLKDIG